MSDHKYKKILVHWTGYDGNVNLFHLHIICTDSMDCWNYTSYCSDEQQSYYVPKRKSLMSSYRQLCHYVSNFRDIFHEKELRGHTKHFGISD